MGAEARGETGAGTREAEDGAGTRAAETGAGTRAAEAGSGTRPAETGAGTRAAEAGSGTRPAETGAGTRAAEAGAGTRAETGAGTRVAETGAGTRGETGAEKLLRCIVENSTLLRGAEQQGMRAFVRVCVRVCVRAQEPRRSSCMSQFPASSPRETIRPRVVHRPVSAKVVLSTRDVWTYWLGAHSPIPSSYGTHRKRECGSPIHLFLGRTPGT